ncbi:DoxX family protein [Puia sp.]|jgi:putative oxidoreductase|uniref:DoxX family protein n=1 Tax=Puia sp. TaxID=2045100 RepID=UPI002F41F677
MKKFFSTAYSDAAFNVATLAIRAIFGLILFYYYGLYKIRNFGHLESVFPDPLHISHRISLVLVIFAELVCTVMLVLGFFTRFAALALVITFCVVEFLINKGHVGMVNNNVHEQAWLYLAGFVAILLLGPGRISIDAAMGK